VDSLCDSTVAILTGFVREGVRPTVLRWLEIFIILALSASGISYANTTSGLPEALTANDFPAQNKDQAELGHMLFYDKILSGNQNISCATCHHPKHFGSDGLSLGIGEGGVGVLPAGLSGLLAAQALFPLASRFEMAGDPEENSVARAAFDRIDHVWPIITKRIKAIPEYVRMFVQSFEHITTASDITIVDVANALAAFQTLEWQSFDSAFDLYLAGDKQALTSLQIEGMNLFYGDAACSECHSGKLFTDQRFYALGLPVFGPGRTRTHDPIPRDTGRMAESDRLADSYRFRTPALRNVEFTGPYGHNGAYSSLEKMLRHHLNPSDSRSIWQRSDANLPDIEWLNDSDFILRDDRREMHRYGQKVDIKKRSLSDHHIQAILAFLESLSGKSIENTPFGVPKTVPSGLPVDQK